MQTIETKLLSLAVYLNVIDEVLIICRHSVGFHSSSIVLISVSLPEFS